MAERYVLGAGRRLGNRFITLGIKLGLVKDSWLLTTRGRRSGSLRTTPVNPLHYAGAWYLVSPYGDVGWVHNLRASGHATVARRNVSEHHNATEVDPLEAAPVLQAYLKKVSVVRPYFDVTVDSSLDEFEAEADRHPVFRLEPMA